jgi:ABC-type glycerol-3-phosphate transport system substrate-binding protein
VKYIAAFIILQVCLKLFIVFREGTLKKLLTLLALLAVLLFVGCGGQKETSAPAEAVETVEAAAEEEVVETPEVEEEASVEEEAAEEASAQE